MLRVIPLMYQDHCLIQIKSNNFKIDGETI
jgi:hypothetical protein